MPPRPLATIITLQVDTFILAHIITPDWQDIVIDDIVIRTVKPRLPALQTSEQPS
jgi:hypothetical protein